MFAASSYSVMERFSKTRTPPRDSHCSPEYCSHGNFILSLCGTKAAEHFQSGQLLRGLKLSFLFWAAGSTVGYQITETKLSISEPASPETSHGS